MAITEYQLSDRFLKDDGRVFLTGVQALARLPIEQMRIDKRNGLKTAAFVSGYPGSPLGGYDMELEKALRLATDVDVVLQPAVNEELGATAVMGSQLATEQPDATYEGVLGIWYGKGPGIDRAGDALRPRTSPAPPRRAGRSPSSATTGGEVIDDSVVVRRNDLRPPHAALLSGRRAGGRRPRPSRGGAQPHDRPLDLNEDRLPVADGSGTVDLGLDRVEIVTPDLSIPGDPNGTIYEPRPEGVSSLQRRSSSNVTSAQSG